MAYMGGCLRACNTTATASPPPCTKARLGPSGTDLPLCFPGLKLHIPAEGLKPADRRPGRPTTLPPPFLFPPPNFQLLLGFHFFKHTSRLG